MPNKQNKTKKNIKLKQKNGGVKNKSYKQKSKKSNNSSSSYKLSSPHIKNESDYMKRLYGSLKEPRAVLKYPRKKGIVKRLRFGRNTIKNFLPDSPESDNSMSSPSSYVKECDYTELESDFPCKYQDTVFNTLDEYNEYANIKKERNVSTGYKSRKEHYREILGNKK